MLIAVLLYGGLHSLLASKKVKTLVQQTFGQGFMRFYRLIYNTFAILSFLPVLAIAVIWPGPTLYQLSGFWLLLSTLGQVFAIVLLVLGLMHTDIWDFLGLRQVLQGERKSDQGLVVHGLYRCIRHPLYAAGLVFIWLTPVMTTSLLVLILSLSLYIVIGSTFEEKRLQAEFGTAYQTYKAQVPRLIPHLGNCLDRKSVDSST
jgi:protein-S-isoprenylcysteine O-methyltransferase Ste14